MSVYAFGVLSVRIRFIFSRNGRSYFQKAVPQDLRGKYPGPNIKVPLELSDPRKLAQLSEQLNNKYEAEFERLRSDPSASPAALKAHAKGFLREWGLEPGQERSSGHGEVTAFDVLDEYVDRKRAAYAERAANEGLFPTSEDAYRSARSASYLEPVELEALKLLHEEAKPTFGEDALKLYVTDSGKSSNEKFVEDTQRAMNGFLAAIGGDRPVAEITREEVKTYVSKELDDGKKTGTVRRRLASLRAVYEHWLKEKQEQRRNPFEGLKIEGEGKDAKKRKPLLPGSRRKLDEECRKADDEMRWLLALLAGTGMRISEGAGLLLSDIVLDDAIPHVVVSTHKWRSLKTEASERPIPLVGLALWAAQRITANAAEGQKVAFPRYCDMETTSGEAASGALNAWMRKKGIPHTCHELRHTMADRLREVQPGSDIIDMIQGWMPKAMRANYGTGYSLRVCHEWLLKMLKWEEGRK